MADNWMLKAVLAAKDGLSPVLKSVANTARQTRKYLGDVGKSAGNLSGRLGLPLTMVSGMLGGFSLVAVKNAVVGLTTMEDELSKLKAATGLSAAEIKRLQYVATVSNVPFEALSGSMAKLNKQIYDAATGKNKELGGLFGKLGIPLRDANGQLRAASDMLPQLADAFARNENPVVRARMGVAMFGKSWQEIMPMLADGSDKLNARIVRFRALGLEVKDAKLFDQQLEQISEFGDQLDDLRFVTKGFQNTIAAGLIPVLKPLTEDLIKWIVANKALVAVKVKEFVTDLVAGLKSVDWTAVIQGAKSFAASLGRLVEWLGGAKNALIALVVVMNIQTIAAFMGVIGSIVRMVWWLGTLTVTAIPAAVVGMGTLKASMLALAGPTNLLLGSLRALVGVAGAGLVGYGIGTLINDNILNPLAKAMSGGKANSFGEWAAGDAPSGEISLEEVNRQRAAQGRAPLDRLPSGQRSLSDVANDRASPAPRLSPDGANAVPVTWPDWDRSRQTDTRSRWDQGALPSGSRPALAGEGVSEGVSSRRSLITPATQVKASGQIQVSFKDAPPGMRVEQSSVGSDVPIDVDVGYRSYALGMP